MSHSTLKKKTITLVSVIIAVIALLTWNSLSSNNNSKTIRTATVEIGTIDSLVMAQGKIEPKKYVTVGAQVTGQIKKLYVDVSDVVKAGQLLAEIDPRIYQSKVEQDMAQLDSIRAQINEQEATLKLASSQHRRNEEMYKQKVISKDTYEQAEANLNVAIAKLESLKAQEKQARSQLSADNTNLEFTKIFAPMDGIIANLPVREGQTLNSVQSAPALMEIDNLDVMTVRTQVAEADIPRISLGMSVYFTTLGDMERKWKGTVRLIQGSPEIINDVVLYNVLIDVENPEHKLMNGMSTQVMFEAGKAENVPTLPIEALGKRLNNSDNDKGSAYQIKIMGDDTPRTIYVGMTDRTRAEIKEGLKVGDVVIIPSRIKPSDKAGRQGGMPPGTGAKL